MYTSQVVRTQKQMPQSRVSSEETGDDEVQIASVRMPTGNDISELLEAPPSQAGLSDFNEEQRKDPELLMLIEGGVLPEDSGKAKKIAAQAPNFTLVDSILYFIDPKCPKQKRVVVPIHLREEIM